MRTKVISSSQTDNPGTYPALFRCTKSSAYPGEIVLLNKLGGTGVIVHSVSISYPVGYIYELCRFVEENGCWERLEGPVTIEFSP